MSTNLTGAIFGGSIVLSRAGSATANVSGVTGAAITFASQNMTYAINGKLFYNTSGTIGTTTPTTDGNTGKAFNAVQKNQGCTFVWCLNAAGAISVVQGPLPISPGTVGTVVNVDDSGNYTAAPQFPGIPDTLCAIAYSVVRLTSAYVGTGFLFGSANWNTTGVVVSTQDVVTLPPSPQTS